MKIAKLLGILSLTALTIAASGCVSRYDTGVQTAVSRPTYGPAHPTKPRPTHYNPTPTPRPDPVHHSYSYKPNRNSTAYNYYPGTQNHTTTVVHTTTVQPKPQTTSQPSQNTVNPNAVYTAPTLNNTATAQPANSVHQPVNSSGVMRPSNTQNSGVARPSNSGNSCVTDADCAANDRCIRTGNQGHCVRQ